MAEKIQKTNAMRALDVANIPYSTQSYTVDESDQSGVHVAETLGVDKEIIFKTIVTRASVNEYRVLVIPVSDELDLKKCAEVTGDKRLELLHVKELLPLTGYIRGGCSPIGMKKKFPTFIDETAILFDNIYISAGVRGTQIIINPHHLAGFVKAKFADLVK